VQIGADIFTHLSIRYIRSELMAYCLRLVMKTTNFSMFAPHLQRLAAAWASCYNTGGRCSRSTSICLHLPLPPSPSLYKHSCCEILAEHTCL